MKTIGFAGTAKNTGKTTAALCVLAQARRAGLKVAVTSIGYDGESLDTITGLPKPRYFEESGMLLATAEGCLKASDARFRVVEVTRARTVLGAVVVAEVLEAGHVLLAGPNRAEDLDLVLRRFRRLDADLVVVDGALNRLVPLIRADGLVLSTGAAFRQDILEVASHAQAIARLFELPRYPEQGRRSKMIQVVAEDGLFTLPFGSLLGKAALEAILASITSPASAVILPGACDPALVEMVVKEKTELLEQASIVFGSPLKLIASGDPKRWGSMFDSLAADGLRAAYLDTLPLLFLTANPAYPRYLSSGRYQEASVDNNALLEELRSSVYPIPVVDVCAQPQPQLLAMLGMHAREEIHA